MWISEIFYSLQGEGELTGVPSVFIRFAGCNLRCSWCDTKYASWTPEGTHLSMDEILAEVERHPAAHVVLTGGEPMIAKELPDLASRLRAGGKHITIETGGHRARPRDGRRPCVRESGSCATPRPRRERFLRSGSSAA